MRVPRRAAKRLLINQLAEAIEEGRVAGLNRDPRQRLFQPERCKFLAGMRQQIDAAFLPRPLVLVNALPRNTLGKLPRESLLRLISQAGGGP